MWRWWSWRRWWLVVVMSVDFRCQKQKKMMGRGADGGCGTEERPCRPVVPKIAVSIPENNKDNSYVDLFSQARKALSERCPFDVAEDGVLSETNLPSVLANLLKQSDCRKRHKKSHSVADKKSSTKIDRSKGASIWLETEEYFRDLALPDIDALSEVATFSSLACKKCFLIPFCGNDDGSNVNVSGGECVNCGKGDWNGVVVNEEVKKDENIEDEKELMDVDGLGDASLVEEEKGCPTANSSEGVEWLLGCKTRELLTSDRPSKKRKLLGSDAGLDKILVGSPCEGNSGICDFCCAGDAGRELNKLIVCISCKVAVHQNCYGVQEDTDGSWLCSWCKAKNNDGISVKQPCVLCPKQGGALKPLLGKSENGGSVQFAHLFCSLLMPEVYIEDMKKMEPIVNMGGIKESRMKSVCNVCKVKHGACVRCSFGACRTAFHPICAREARHKLEVWGKYGCDNVELRAFCAKHSVQDDSNMSRVGDTSSAVGSSNYSGTNHQRGTLPMNRLQKVKICRKNGDKIAVHMETSDANSDRTSDSEEMGFSDSRLNGAIMSECGEEQQLTNVGMLERSDSGDVNPSDSLTFALILKKLIDRGKVNVKEVALEIGIQPDSLNTKLADGSLAPDMRSKIVKWLSNHAYFGSLQKSLKLKLKSSISSKADSGATDSDSVIVSESDISDPVAVKSVPPRRRTNSTKSSIRVSRDNKVMCSSGEVFNDKERLMDEVKVDQLDRDAVNFSEVPLPDATEKSSTTSDGFEDSLARDSPKPEGNAVKPSDSCFSNKCQSEGASTPGHNTSEQGDQENPLCSAVNLLLPDLLKTETSSGFYVHPHIQRTLLGMQSGMLLTKQLEFGGQRDGEMSRLESSSDASVCCNHQSQHSKCSDFICKSDGVNLEQLVKARKQGVLELSPIDEVEGEIIYFQHRLLSRAVARKQFADNLVSKVAKNLPKEIDDARMRRWDAVLVNQYLYELREAKKQGRKERRHKEAQAVLAAATAAAAASSRISSLRKDSLEESAYQENLLKSTSYNGRAGISTQVMSRAKETLSRVAVPRVSLEKYSDSVNSVSDFSKEHPRSCDICRHSETILNPILVCSACKVAVHLDCYRSVKESMGPWYCELCEELSFRSSGVPSVNFWEKPYLVAECGLCGGTTGAFRKSADGQWLHAFCAEWVFESTFRRGQVNPVVGMETISKGIDTCCICRRKQGVCIKCNYGHCQTTFHPTCGRSTGFYMNVKYNGGNFQHKAYCEKHSLEQRAKAETQKHGVEELKSMRQIRVELERLRLLCERIIKREKIKRELILCSQEILAFKRDHAARVVLGRTPFFPPDVSSESATTSLKGHTDGYRSCSEALQRSDDVTVDSFASFKPRLKIPMSMEADQKTDDSSTSQNLFIPKPSERVTFSGKQIPHRPLLSRSLSNEEEWSSKARKHFETFEKEMVMTSDEASMKNRKLPKGYLFVPLDCLPKEKQIKQNTCSVEPGEPDG